jgi:CheY-like chemotaxis protein
MISLLYDLASTFSLTLSHHIYMILPMNGLSTAKRTQVIAALVEGNSLRATSRMTGASKVTILRLLEDLGAACAAYQDEALRNLNCKRIQCDEIWQFCYAKEKNVPAEKQGQFGFGDVWTWAAMCADTKLIVTWALGTRGAGTAIEFMHDLAGRLAHRVQLTTDGHRVYLNAVESAFGADIDYAMLVKIYGGDATNETKYSPAEFIDCKQIAVTGRPDPRHISTSYIERQNLTMRMGSVLCVVSDPSVAGALRAILEKDGYHVVAVSTAQDALDILHNETPEVILAEAEGDEISPKDLCAIVKTCPRLQHIPVILLTTSALPSDYATSHQIGAVVCMMIPCKPERLRSAIHLVAAPPALTSVYSARFNVASFVRTS